MQKPAASIDASTMPLYAAMVAKYRTMEEADGSGGGGIVIILAQAAQRRRILVGGLTRTTRGVRYGDGGGGSGVVMFTLSPCWSNTGSL
jgi:hypothetical protein